MTTYLEYIDEKSHKFWEIILEGNTHTVRYGKIGTNGRSSTKEFDDEAQAQKEADKLIASKKKKGYAEAKLAKQTEESSSKAEEVKETVPKTYEDLIEEDVPGNMRVFLALKEAKTHKYCDVELSGQYNYEGKNDTGIGKYVILREGKDTEDDGADDKKETKYKNHKTAKKEAIKLINEKKEKGYVVTHVTKLSEEKYQEIHKLMKKIEKNQKGHIYSANDLKGNTLYEEFKKKKPAFLKPFLIDLLIYLGCMNEYRVHDKRDLADALTKALLRKNLSHNEDELIAFLKEIHRSTLDYYNCQWFSQAHIIQHIERLVKKNGLSERLKAFIKEMLAWRYIENDSIPRLKAIISDKKDKKIDDNIIRYHQTGNESIDEIIKNSDLYPIKEFHDYFRIKLPSGMKPTEKFKKEVANCIAILGADKFRIFAHTILELKERNYEFIRIIWSVESFADEKTVALVGKILEHSVKNANMAIGNASVFVLGDMLGIHGLGVLSRIKPRIKQNSIRQRAENCLIEAAKERNISLGELEEMVVPDYDLIDGKKTVHFADYKLNIFIEGNKVLQEWVKPDGKTIKSIPSVVKKDPILNTKLKDLRVDIKEMQKLCTAQKEKLDNQFIWDKTWEYAYFNTYFVSHGLVSAITKSIIFTIQKGKQKTDAIYYNKKWETVSGETLTWVDNSCTIKLWHPIYANENEIVAWRDYIIDNEIQQSLKQAFREIYILTDAEVNTKDYSNRMASHVLKQHQFAALAELRDWGFTKIGYIDNGAGDTYRNLEEYGIKAKYELDGIQDNSSLFFEYIATGRLIFYKGKKTMNLENVPTIVFSEIMRDLDLFVGVCSVGNDPHWHDDEYWQSHSFGNLSEIAKTRKSILERLLPRLTKLKGKAEIKGKFLIVKGDIRTYKIHIGSSNILMEPNDQYLCIVPTVNEKSTSKLFIPFEGDRGLSIVLSKAFLLAEDIKIKDSTITSQINR